MAPCISNKVVVAGLVETASDCVSSCGTSKGLMVIYVVSYSIFPGWKIPKEVLITIGKSRGRKEWMLHKESAKKRPKMCLCHVLKVAVLNFYFHHFHKVLQ